jgi:hypothetical protein
MKHLKEGEMNEIALTENEEKILILILFEHSITERAVKKILEWDDEVFTKSRDSLLAKKLIHNLQPEELQFGKRGKEQALKIVVKRGFHYEFFLEK